MAIEVASAFVSLMPTIGRGAGRKIESELGSAAGGVGGIGKSIGSTFGKAITAGLAAAGIGQFLAGAFEEARDAQKTAAQTAAVIASTGAAAGVTAKQVDTLASSLSKKSGVDDELIASGQNMLLTFTNVRNEAGKGNDVFDQATKLALDMSVAMGTDLKNANIQVGKALQDPIKGISALSRVGIQFTEEQKAQIKTLTESGDVMGAQKIILAELARQFEGSAEAQATAGDKAAVAWGNFQETVGTALLPVLDTLLTFFTDDLLPGVEDFASGLGDKLGPAAAALGPVVQDLGKWFRDDLLPILKDLWAWLVTNLVPIWETLVEFFTTKVVPAVQKIWKAFQDFLAAAEPVAVWIYQRFAAAFQFLIEILSGVFDWIKDNADWVVPILLGFAAAAAALKIFQALWSKSPFGVIVTAVLLIGAFIRDNWDQIAQFFSDIWNWIADLANTVWQFIKSYIWNPITEVWAFLVMVWEAVWGFLVSVWQGIVDAALAAWGWIKTYIITPISEAWTWLVATWDAIGIWLGDVWNGIKETANTVWGFIKDNIIGPIQDAWDWIVNAWGSIARWLTSLWRGIEDTASVIWNGIVNVIKSVLNFFIDAINLFIDAYNFFAEPFKTLGIIDITIDPIPKIPVDNGPSVGRRATGGPITGPGTGTSDSILTWLSDGEYVINARQTSKYLPLLHAINYGRDIPGFVFGGQVGGGDKWTKKAKDQIDKVVHDKGLDMFGFVNDLVENRLGPELAAQALARAFPERARGLGAAAGAGNLPPTAGGDLQAWVRQAMSITGVPGDWFVPLVGLAMHESGGNPSAINLWDINAQRGIPSQGLFQTIPSTFAAYGLGGSITDPVANAVAAIRYILARYGSIYSIPSYRGNGVFVGGYANGGFVDETGLALVHRGETVFTAEQTRSGLGGRHYEIHLHQQRALPSERELVSVIQDVDFLYGGNQ